LRRRLNKRAGIDEDRGALGCGELACTLGLDPHHGLSASVGKNFARDGLIHLVRENGNVDQITADPPHVGGTHLGLSLAGRLFIDAIHAESCLRVEKHGRFAVPRSHIAEPAIG